MWDASWLSKPQPFLSLDWPKRQFLKCSKLEYRVGDKWWYTFEIWEGVKCFLALILGEILFFRKFPQPKCPSKENWDFFRFNPLIPKISLVILLTVCQTILIMLVWRIWYWINLFTSDWYFSLFSSLIWLILRWYCKEKFCLGHSWELKG